jgi:hypothetical protein
MNWIWLVLVRKQVITLCLYYKQLNFYIWLYIYHMYVPNPVHLSYYEILYFYHKPIYSTLSTYT